MAKIVNLKEEIDRIVFDNELKRQKQSIYYVNILTGIDERDEESKLSKIDLLNRKINRIHDTILYNRVCFYLDLIKLGGLYELRSDNDEMIARFETKEEAAKYIKLKAFW